MCGTACQLVFDCVSHRNDSNLVHRLTLNSCRKDENLLTPDSLDLQALTLAKKQINGPKQFFFIEQIKKNSFILVPLCRFFC